MRSVEEHQHVVAGLITARPGATAELPDAEGRVLFDDVTATVALPVFDDSAMDGYAVRADEVAMATSGRPVKLPVAEDIPAGRTDIPALQPGTAHRIMTGAPIPAAVRAAGAEVVATAIAGDDVAQFTALLDRYAAESDLIITSGGVSAGAYEVVKDAFGRAGDGRVEFVKVAMQPGMPQGAGRVAGTPIVTLPGNPVSALVSFEVFIRPALRSAMGLPAPHRPRRSAVLTETLTSPAGKRQFRRGVFDPAGTAVSHGPPGSHHLGWLASANCLLDIPADVTDVPAGSQVQIWDLR
ncbi:molybdopterin molybdotransferase MoeA [Candidatus Mycobacterium methanotrophicum]|uniref:Molybdopterin molybdenumtransferase n=1 Tax=Candidatus Mycobacterium methanotrophicum TaxID=2943498 RepID=A0ABY4QNU4_9MYCO|nr:molybdopterin molybdotransferase MoeA [Candidatus Mycobacterium methanotrophicum]UQX11454.1 molybdopterin molybdotransferase MoeA [Candidatus Mycobacterium methanotrophicum]